MGWGEMRWGSDPWGWDGQTEGIIDGTRLPPISGVTPGVIVPRDFLDHRKKDL